MGQPVRTETAGEGAVVVSAEARALFRAMRCGLPAPLTSGATAPLPETALPVAADPPPDPAPGPPPAPTVDAQEPPLARFLLRRDGQRPLAVRGAELTSWSLDDPDSGARFMLALYLTEQGDVAAALTAAPQVDAPIRPVHVAERIAAPDALEALLARFDPAAGAPVDVGLSGDLADRSAALAVRLRAGFDRFAVMLRAGRRASLPR